MKKFFSRILNVVRFIKASLGVLIFSVKKCAVRLKFPFEFYGIIKSESNCDYDYYKALNIISTLRPDNGSLCSVHCDPIVHNDKRLTIIIPVYNVEAYIEQCLNSIISQKTNFEFIINIVDDGSTDKTLVKVKEYAAKHKCISVTSQKNSSQSVARNNALNFCDSEWVMMVDGDDILSENALQTLMDIAINENCDVVEGTVQGFYEVFEKEYSQNNKDQRSIHSSLNQQFILTSKGYSCGKLYRRTLWENVRYPERYIFEDIITKYVICRKALKYARTNKVVYGYRMRSDSSSHTNDNRRLDCLWVMDKVQLIRENNNIPNDNINHILMMNHFGMLTPLMVSKMDFMCQKAALEIARYNLIKWKVNRSSLPYFFRKSYDAIMEINVEAWFLTFKTISDYRFITRFREIN